MMFQLREVMVSGNKAASGFVGKRDPEMDRAYNTTMDSDQEAFRKRKRREDSEDVGDHRELLLSNNQHIPITSFYDPERRLTHEEDSKKSIMKPDYYNNPMSLDLELNLSPSLINLNHHHHCHHYLHYNNSNDGDNYDHNDHHHHQKKKREKGSAPGPTRRALSWLGLDRDEEEEGEMVARVCIKCHFLVMLCKASPSCPNCKFMHSPQQTSQSNSLFFSPKPPFLSLIN